MLKLPTSTTRLQTVARRTMIGLCSVLALGVIGSVAVRGSQPGAARITVVQHQPTLAAEETQETADDTLAEAQLASDTTVVPATELLQDVPEAPAAPEKLTSQAPAVKSGAVRVRLIRMLVTAYCPCTKCCGPNAQGITASGKRVSYNHGHFVAADTSRLPFGTKLLIPGYGDGAVEVIDRGGAIKGNHLDVFFPTHQQALDWGRRYITVTVIE
jgi:3D (Asp-Asp-Asp) domain-containing protein